MLRRLYDNSTSGDRPGRPVGVAVIAVLCFCGALLVGYYALGALLALLDVSPDAAGVGGQLLLGVVLAALLLAIGWGLWRLRRWAQWLAAGSLLVAIVLIAADSLSRYGIGAGLSTALALALSRSIAPLGMVLYLLHPSIAKSFK